MYRILCTSTYLVLVCTYVYIDIFYFITVYSLTNIFFVISVRACEVLCTCTSHLVHRYFALVQSIYVLVRCTYVCVQHTSTYVHSASYLVRGTRYIVPVASYTSREERTLNLLSKCAMCACTMYLPVLLCRLWRNSSTPYLVHMYHVPRTMYLYYVPGT